MRFTQIQTAKPLTLLLVIIASCPSCSTTPNAHITTRPEKVVLSKDIISKSGEIHGNRAYDIILPLGTYIFAREESSRAYYEKPEGTITKKWTGNPNESPSRERPGGIYLVKNSGAWGIYTFGPSDDLRQDGIPPIGVMSAKKINGAYFNELGILGRTDENNQMVPIVLNRAFTVMAAAEDVGGITFVGSVPF